MNRITTKPLERGPKWARTWANSVLADLRRTHIATIAKGQAPGMNETADGTGLVVGGGGGAGGTVETVTGAVNGAPATLNVLTDGSGWTAV